MDTKRSMAALYERAKSLGINVKTYADSEMDELDYRAYVLSEINDISYSRRGNMSKTQKHTRFESSFREEPRKFPENRRIRDNSTNENYEEAKTMIGKLYKHESGGIFVVTGIVRHITNKQPIVLYMKCGDPDKTIWARDYDDWFYKHDANNKETVRFTVIKSQDLL